MALLIIHRDRDLGWLDSGLINVFNRIERDSCPSIILNLQSLSATAAAAQPHYTRLYSFDTYFMIPGSQSGIGSLYVMWCRPNNGRYEEFLRQNKMDHILRL